MFGSVHLGPLVASSEIVDHIFCLFVAYFFSLFYWIKISAVKAQWVKNLYITAVGNLFLLICFPVLHVLQLYIPILFTYYLTKSFRKEWWMPFANMAGIFSYLIGVHIYRQFLSAKEAEKYLTVAMPLMQLTIKVTSFAFDIYDSSLCSDKTKNGDFQDTTKPPSCVDKGTLANIKLIEPITTEMKDKFSKLIRYPNLLEFIGYSMLFPGVLVGPTVYFHQYRCLIDGTYMLQANRTRGALSARKRRYSYLLSMGVLFMVLYGVLDCMISVRYIADPGFFIKPLWYRIVYAHICKLFIHCQYYAAWMIAEGSYVALGMGLRIVHSGQPLWDQHETVNPFITEAYTHYKTFLNNWNKCIVEWLNLYFYNRIKGHYKSSRGDLLALVCTLLLSALWHGFHPGYYMTALSAAWFIYVSRCKSDYVW